MPYDLVSYFIVDFILHAEENYEPYDYYDGLLLVA